MKNIKILMHQCCGPCSIYPLSLLKKEGAQVAAYFYNPNIHPCQEYYRRLEAAAEACRLLETAQIRDEGYGLTEFLRQNVFREEERCSFCYETRLYKTAEKALELGFPFFTSSLLYSKTQNHNLLRSAGEKAAEKYGVKFYYRDFRDGWEEGIRISKEIGIYRQNYCGCVYSEMDRFHRQLSEKFRRKYPPEAETFQ